MKRKLLTASEARLMGEDLVSKIILEKQKLRKLLTQLSESERDLREEKLRFEEKMKEFRSVCTKSWDVVIAYQSDPFRASHEITRLAEALDSTDHLWEGFAGCATDAGVEAVA